MSVELPYETLTSVDEITVAVKFAGVVGGVVSAGGVSIVNVGEAALLFTGSKAIT